MKVLLALSSFLFCLLSLYSLLSEARAQGGAGIATNYRALPLQVLVCKYLHCF